MAKVNETASDIARNPRISFKFNIPIIKIPEFQNSTILKLQKSKIERFSSSIEYAGHLDSIFSKIR